MPLSKEKIERIKEIDALWLRNGEVVYEFEVGNTTEISDAIIRGANIPSTSIKRFIIILEERQKLLMKIAEPILKESIEQYGWNFIFYDTLIPFYEKNKQRKIIEAIEIDKLELVNSHKTRTTSPGSIREIGTNLMKSFVQTSSSLKIEASNDIGKFVEDLESRKRMVFVDVNLLVKRDML